VLAGTCVGKQGDSVGGCVSHSWTDAAVGGGERDSGKNDGKFGYVLIGWWWI